MFCFCGKWHPYFWRELNTCMFIASYVYSCTNSLILCRNVYTQLTWFCYCMHKAIDQVSGISVTCIPLMLVTECTVLWNVSKNIYYTGRYINFTAMYVHILATYSYVCMFYSCVCSKYCAICSYVCMYVHRYVYIIIMYERNHDYYIYDIIPT